MDRKHMVVILFLIVVILALIVGIFSISTQPPKVHTVDVGIGTFNCSKDINFTLVNSSDGFYEYANENLTYSVKVVNFNETSSAYAYGYNLGIDEVKKFPSSTIDGVIVYNSTANVGEYVGELRHSTFIDNHDKNVNVHISTPSVEETILITKTFEFR